MNGKLLENIVIATVSRTHDEFAQKVAEFAGQTIDITDTIEPDRFSGGEFRPRFRAELKGKNIYLIVTQGPWQNPLEMVARTVVMADSAKGTYGAKKVTAVMTEMPFARQDKDPEEYEKFQGEAFSAKSIAKMLHAGGIDRILTMHMHSPELYKIYSKVFGCKDGREVIYDISPYHILAHYLMNYSSLDISNGGEKIGFISPDKNAKRFVESLMNLMQLPNAVLIDFEKARKVPNKPGAVKVNISNLEELKKINFSFKGKFLVYTDDMIDTGSTLIATHDWIYVRYRELDHGLGIPAGMYYYFTHSVLSGNNFSKIQETLVKRLPAIEYITTNTRPHISDNQTYRFKERCTILRVASLFADAILNCCEKDVHPEEYYKYDSLAELNRIIQQKELYDIKRSSRHLMNRRIDMINTS